MSQATDIIKNKFNELGYSKFDPIPVPKDIISLISQLEDGNTIKLPDEYKYFLEHYGECNFETDAVYRPIKSTPSVNSEGFQEISFFYGVGTEYDISKMLETYSQRIPEGFITIAELPGGNQLCMDSRPSSSNYGKIYLWDHENECDRGFENIYLVADHFSGFIDLFEKEKEKSDRDDSIESFRLDF